MSGSQVTEKSILIIDSDQSSRNFLERIFEEQHYKVLQTGLGKEGLIYAWRDRPDLIVFDPELRDINPEEFLQKIRQDARSANVPVMALSNDPSETKKQACLQLGCNEYLLKSGEIVSTLPEIVAKLMGIKKVVVKEIPNLAGVSAMPFRMMGLC